MKFSIEYALSDLLQASDEYSVRRKARQLHISSIAMRYISAAAKDALNEAQVMIRHYGCRTNLPTDFKAIGRGILNMDRTAAMPAHPHAFERRLWSELADLDYSGAVHGKALAAQIHRILADEPHRHCEFTVIAFLLNTTPPDTALAYARELVAEMRAQPPKALPPTALPLKSLLQRIAARFH